MMPCASAACTPTSRAGRKQTWPSCRWAAEPPRATRLRCRLLQCAAWLLLASWAGPCWHHGAHPAAVCCLTCLIPHRLQSGGYAVSGRIGDVSLPTLVVWGRNDEILS